MCLFYFFFQHVAENFVVILSLSLSFSVLKEDKLRGRPGYEHLNDPLHILIEAELPANVIDARLRQAQEIIEELLKPVVTVLWSKYPFTFFYFFALYSDLYSCSIFENGNLF